MIRSVFFLLVSAFFSLQASALIIDPVSWTFEAEKVSKNEFILLYKAEIDSPWNLYGMDVPPGGPRPVSFTRQHVDGVEVLKKVHPTSKPEIKYDPSFEMDIPMHAGTVVFQERIRVTELVPRVSGVLEFMVCDDNSCLPPKEVDFVFELQLDASDIAAGHSGRRALLWVFLLAFAGGVLAIFTPCVFPMIPMIVSFFTRGNPPKSKVIRDALFFGFSMIAIYLSLGLVVSLLNVNPNVANEISSHWLSNSIFFVLFVVFAISFFGAFEMMLPNGLANKSDNQANKGGLIGVFFIALTTVIVGFSCTGPIIGAILIDAAGGVALEPIVGMLGFALAFSAPFTLLAFFPSVMKKLPKSGGWMNIVKIIFAFLLLAFALTFLSNISQSYHLNLISRELFLSVWIVLSILLGFYLMGKIRFAHDVELPYVSTPRILGAIFIFSFSLYLFTGLFGNPLKGLSTLLPPASQHATLLGGQQASIQQKAMPEDLSENCYEPLYAHFLTKPHGLTGYFDYQQGKDCASEQGKPLLVVFKGHQCSACKEMENRVWPDVLPLIQQEFVLVSLFTDDRKSLPEAEQYISDYDGRKVTSIGRKFADLQISKYNSNTIPFHVLLDAQGNVINTMGHTRSVEDFRSFLETALEDSETKTSTQATTQAEDLNVGQEADDAKEKEDDGAVRVSAKPIFQF